MTKRNVRPRSVFVGKVGSLIEPGPDLRRKLELLAGCLDPVHVTMGDPGVRHTHGNRVIALPRLRPTLLAAIVFYLLAPCIGVVLAIGRRPAVVVCQSVLEGVVAGVAMRLIPRRVRPGLVVEVHGDWRAATRHYGRRARRLASPFVDRLAISSLRRADRVRVIGAFTRSLVEESGYTGEIDSYVTFSAFDAFLSSDPHPLPSVPRAIFIGALQRTKSPDVLVECWPRVLDRVPNAELAVVGSGPMACQLVDRSRRLGVSGSIAFLGSLSREEVARELDDSWVLVLPSRSEGLGRVVLEAMARARPVVGSRVGGIPELVTDDRGLLVPVGDPVALGSAIASILADRGDASRKGECAREYVAGRDPAAEFASGVARLAAWAQLAPWRGSVPASEEDRRG